MVRYRIRLWHHEQLWGDFIVEPQRSEAVVQALLALWSAGQGYRCELARASDERRILESGPQGVRVLGVEYLFEAIPASAPA
ncbi:hypothetical protein SAMN02745857_02136 [Andreprevotia lacus DSM 23236]|jgi:hypothetical protein|uniref:Uncharacterized protein n=1 Tax=Andreprevotia lacus DSM 23236 TaxID=1121001 RepID=A0A1W1XNA1_9NEIS|nr:hypothetical protein [Andreprevotia lacus]SMC25342.1 hypothetical protein SAMN02745857_02136 [Andreprevotia lacus DSM 23236]